MSSTARRNWLLNSIEPVVRETFADRMRLIELPKGRVLLEQGEEVEKVYFPEGALIGLLSATAAGDTVETAILGWDGALGVFEACGSRRSAFQAEVQAPGAAWRMSASAYREMFSASEGLRTAVHKYIELLLTEARQHLACNVLHPVKARLCRSILEALDRSQDGRRLPVTQDVLAEMIGVQRTTVSSAVAALQRRGLLSSTRGALDVIDRGGLEREACSCRAAIQAAWRGIYGSEEEVCEDSET